MGNPFCPKCKVLLVTANRTVETGHDKLGRKTYGRRRVWLCPKCKRTWKKGAEIIQQKPEPKPRCYGRKFDTIPECPVCESRDKCKAEKEARDRQPKPALLTTPFNVIKKRIGRK